MLWLHNVDKAIQQNRIKYIIKNWIINSRDLIGLAVMIYKPLNHAGEIATIKLSSGCSWKAKSARSSNISDCF